MQTCQCKSKITWAAQQQFSSGTKIFHLLEQMSLFPSLLQIQYSQDGGLQPQLEIWHPEKGNKKNEGLWDFALEWLLFSLQMPPYSYLLIRTYSNNIHCLPCCNIFFRIINTIQFIAIRLIQIMKCPWVSQFVPLNILMNDKENK